MLVRGASYVKLVSCIKSTPTATKNRKKIENGFWKLEAESTISQKLGEVVATTLQDFFLESKKIENRIFEAGIKIEKVSKLSEIVAHTLTSRQEQKRKNRKMGFGNSKQNRQSGKNNRDIRYHTKSKIQN